MDVALIKMGCLADKRPQEIYWQENDVEPRIKKNTTCNLWDSLGNSQDAEKHIKVVSRLSRSGFYTRGIVSDFKAVTVFEGKGQPASSSLEGEAWAISCPRKFDSVAEARRTQWLMGKDVYPFCRAGDSGSFVIAAAGWEYDGHDNKISMLSDLQEATGMLQNDRRFDFCGINGLRVNVFHSIRCCEIGNRIHDRGNISMATETLGGPPGGGSEFVLTTGHYTKVYFTKTSIGGVKPQAVANAFRTQVFKSYNSEK